MPSNTRIANFNAGPSMLPEPVLDTLRATIADHEGKGLSIIEASHRSSMYEAVHDRAIELLRSLLGIPDGYHVLFLGGGATLQFAMVPMNLLVPGKRCAYTRTGAWAEKAIEEAEKFSEVDVVFDGSADGYTALPESLSVPKDSSYLHITTNETIHGVEWHAIPRVDATPLVADMSSDIMSRPFDVSKLGLFYAGAQKNLGPAGVTVVVIRDDLLERSGKELPTYLQYRVHADKNSLYNTPPVFSIYALELVLEWVVAQGGVEAMDRTAEEKSRRLYDAIDSSGGFYRNPVSIGARSRMNVVFTLATGELEKRFLTGAEAVGMIGLKGHRSVGGCRASLYNALPMWCVDDLVEYMREFARTSG